MIDITGLDLQNKTAHISSLNKTPASILQEYAAKNHIIPNYSVIENDISQNKITFKVSLTLDDYQTIGEGSSKKEAKHVASLKMLKQMITDKPQLLENEFKQWDFENHVVSPYDNNIKENAVGKLNDICANNRLGLPVFSLVREEGQAHAKLFTIRCQVAKMLVDATHKTKKQAKHYAAVNMINKLLSISKSLLMVCEPKVPDSAHIVDQVEAIRSTRVKKTPPMDEEVCNYHLLFKKNEWCESNTLNTMVESYFSKGELILVDSYITLQKIVKEAAMTFVEKEIDEQCITNHKKYYYMCIENVYPPIYSLGVGDKIEEAKEKATVNLLTNICILLK